MNDPSRSALLDAPDIARIAERMAGEERYSFYYVGSSTDGVLGQARSENRLEMRFVGKDVFIVETFAPEGSGEKVIQSYRFTRR